jgi:hypothetical protein
VLVYSRRTDIGPSILCRESRYDENALKKLPEASFVVSLEGYREDKETRYNEKGECAITKPN